MTDSDTFSRLQETYSKLQQEIEDFGQEIDAVFKEKDMNEILHDLADERTDSLFMQLRAAYLIKDTTDEDARAVRFSEIGFERFTAEKYLELEILSTEELDRFICSCKRYLYQTILASDNYRTMIEGCSMQISIYKREQKKSFTEQKAIKKEMNKFTTNQKNT